MGSEMCIRDSLDTEEYLPVDLLAKVRGLADDQGYVKDGINRYV